jgi:hypothetical protein
MGLSLSLIDKEAGKNKESTCLHRSTMDTGDGVPHLSPVSEASERFAFPSPGGDILLARLAHLFPSLLTSIMMRGCLNFNFF